MCGIAGIYAFRGGDQGTEETVAKMVTMLHHRGPDECGIFRDRHVCLGHTRLSILGLESGTQPMANEDESLWIVYNGEVFNYLELQQGLEQKGYRFTTGSDTEVVLAMYQEYGADCLRYLNGQFAMAIWDRRKQELFLARDRVGIRPLFYTWCNGQFLFASEIKALFACAQVQRSIDPQALMQISTFWTTITPSTAFTGVLELPPGSFMVIREGRKSHPEPYWVIPAFNKDDSWSGTFSEAKEELHALLKDAIRLRLRADVPVGSYLSGGLDSSIITALAATSFNNRLRTFSLAFEENPFDESYYQRELVEALGTEHSEIRVTNTQIREHLPEVIWHCEKPLLRTGPVPLYSLSKLVRDSRFKVVLTGEGADEIFGGYNIFKEAKLRRFWARQPDSAWRGRLLERLYPYIFEDAGRAKLFLKNFFAVKPGDLKDPFFSHRVRWRNSGKNSRFFSGALKQQLVDYDPYQAMEQRLSEGFNAKDPFSQAQFLEMDVFLSNYLLSSQGDRVGMGNSIELRLPFLDHRVIEFAAKLPAYWKIKGLNEKYILKEAFRELVPDAIRNRPKQPYRAPIRESFWTDEPGSYVSECLSHAALKKSGYFDPAKVQMLAQKFTKESKDRANEVQNMALMGVLTTQLLHEQYIEKYDPGKIEPTVPDKLVRILD
jgi:asparagine synthase (glutamine-hydrolysing)